MLLLKCYKSKLVSEYPSKECVLDVSKNSTVYGPATLSLRRFFASVTGRVARTPTTAASFLHLYVRTKLYNKQ